MMEFNQLLNKKIIVIIFLLSPIFTQADIIKSCPVYYPHLQLAFGVPADTSDVNINHSLVCCDIRKAKPNITNLNGAGLVELGVARRTLFSNDILSYVSINAFTTLKTDFDNTKTTTESVYSSTGGDSGQYVPGIFKQTIHFKNLSGVNLNIGQNYTNKYFDNYTGYFTVGWAVTKIINDISWKLEDDPNPPSHPAPNHPFYGSTSYHDNGFMWGVGFIGPALFLNDMFQTKNFEFSLNVNVINLKKKSLYERLNPPTEPDPDCKYETCDYAETDKTNIIMAWAGIIYKFQ